MKAIMVCTLLSTACLGLTLSTQASFADDICSEAAGGECEAAQDLTDLADDTPTVPDALVDEAQESIDTQDDNVNN